MILFSRLDAVRQALNAAAKLVPAVLRVSREPSPTRKISAQVGLTKRTGNTTGVHQHRCWQHPRQASLVRAQYMNVF